MRSHGLHVISPPHRILLRTPHRLAPTKPDPIPMTFLYHTGHSHETASRNSSQWSWATWPLPEITWASCDKCITTRHLIGRLLNWRPWDLRVPTAFFFDLFLSSGVLMLF